MQRHIRTADHFKLLSWLSVCVLVVSMGCPSSANAVVGGRVDPNTATSLWAGVGSLSVNGGTYTATAIGPHFILTAAHVVDRAAAQNISFNLNAGGDLSHSIKASAIHVYPEYHGFIPSAADGLVHNDLAVIELSSDLPAGIPIYSLLTGIPEIPPAITMVGYGRSGDGVNGTTIRASASVKRVGGNQVDQLLIGQNGKADMYMFDFDGSTSSTNVMGGGALANEAQLGTGDSGSPAFIRTNAGWQIFGVNTFVGATAAGADYFKFGALGGGTLTSAYAGWIQGIVTAPQVVAAASVAAPVPKPASIGMMLSGGLLFLWVARRRREDI